jgi:hypothetical protein
MIGRRDERRKDEATKKAELELKKKKEAAVREVCVVAVMSRSFVEDVSNADAAILACGTADPRCRLPCSSSTTRHWFL